MTTGLRETRTKKTPQSGAGYGVIFSRNTGLIPTIKPYIYQLYLP